MGPTSPGSFLGRRASITYLRDRVSARGSLTGRHQLERDVTWQYLDKYLPLRGRLLEVGAATGAYTLELARRGYEVLAVIWLSNSSPVRRPKRVRRVYRRVSSSRLGMHASWRVFPKIRSRGPAHGATVPLGTSEGQNAGILGDVMKSSPSWIENEREVVSLIQRRHRPNDASRGGFRAYYVAVEEIAPLHEQAGFQTVVVAGVEPAISADDES